jgi:hypothetical protein
MNEEVLETVRDELEETDAPEVLTVYLPSTDLLAHHTEGDALQTQRRYLREEVDSNLLELLEQLREMNALENRYVVVVTDHGHTDLVADEAHALEPKLERGPAAVLQSAGFRVRPFEWRVDDRAFQAVFAYQEALAYVYLADRSACSGEKETCDWSRPPRFEEDVLAAAEALFQANRGHGPQLQLKDTLDLILVRRMPALDEVDAPYEVYLGEGRHVPLGTFLAEHPRPSYVDFARRLKQQTVGKRGERAGDLLLLAHFGDREDPSGRFYFASPEESGHGSPSRQDGAMGLVVAHPGASTEELQRTVRDVLGASPGPPDVGRLIVRLRGTTPGED